MNVQPKISQAIDQLETTPNILRLFGNGLSEAQSSAKPSDVSWSVSEIIAHLVHTEHYCYGSRVQHILSGATAIVPSYDAKRFEAEGAYSGVPLMVGLARLGEARSVSARQLRGLKESDFGRRAIHESVGEFTLGELIYEWAAHDVGHIRQVAIVIRDVLYNPFIGSFRD
jgi:hypothetical protein